MSHDENIIQHYEFSRIIYNKNFFFFFKRDYSKLKNIFFQRNIRLIINYLELT